MPKKSPTWKYFVLHKSNPCNYCSKYVNKMGRDVKWDESLCTCDKNNKQWFVKCLCRVNGQICSCGKKIRFDIHSKRTSDMIHHLKQNHSKTLQKNKKIDNQSNECSKKVNESLTKLLSSPSSNPGMVKDKNFKDIFSTINTFLPNSNHITIYSDEYYRNRIKTISEEEKLKTREEIRKLMPKIKQKISIGVDESEFNGIKYNAFELYALDEELNFRSFILEFSPIEGSNNGETLAKEVRKVMQFYGIENICALVGDGAPYNQKAAKILNVPFERCIVHLINLTVSDMFKECGLFKSLIVKLNSIKNHFSHSPSDYKKLNDYCRNKITLKTFSRTRFGSSFKTIESFLLKRDGIQMFNSNLITSEEWIVLYQFKCILGIINSVSDILSSTSTITRDKVIILFNDIKKQFTELRVKFASMSNNDILLEIQNELEQYKETEESDEEDGEPCEDVVSSSENNTSSSADCSFWEQIGSIISKRLDPIIDNNDYKIALYLSPLYRNLFMKEDDLVQTRNIIKKKLDEKSRFNHDDIVNEIRGKLPLPKHFDREINDFALKMEEITEIESFENVLTTETASEFWSKADNQTKYPNLFDLALSSLHIPCSSIGIERIFSKANSILTQRNTRSSPSYFASRVFLRSSQK